MGTKNYIEPTILDNDHKPIYYFSYKNKILTDTILELGKKCSVISCQSGEGKTIFLQNYFIRKATNYIKDLGSDEIYNKLLPFYFTFQEISDKESIIDLFSGQNHLFHRWF